MLHGFVLDDDGDFRVVDHPDAATTIGPNLPITGTNLSGINDRGFYDLADGTVRGFLRDRRGRFTDIDAPVPRAAPW